MKIDWLYWLGVALLFVGWFYALAPHAFHVQSGLGLGQEHDTHTLEGLVLVVLGLGVLIYDSRKNKASASVKKKQKKRK